MNFDSKLLSEYEELLRTTNLVVCYQEFIKLFRYIRVEMEKSMPEYTFQGNITENGMDYSYFSFTSHQLREKGLKIAIVFVHKEFQFEVWLSGFNRKYQCKYYEQLKGKRVPFELTGDPTRKDYIFRVILDKSIDISNGSLLINQIKSISSKLLMFVDTL